MEEAKIIGIIVFILIVICIGLLMHHAYIHRRSGNHPLEGCDQCFQMSDCGNCLTCNHEMWIVGFASIAFILLIYFIIVHVLAK